MTSGTGTCTVTFDQAGDSNYDAAAPVVQTTTAQKADPTVTATGNTCTYDANPGHGSGSAKGVLGEDLTTVNVAYKDALGNLLTSAPVNAGTYSVAYRQRELQPEAECRHDHHLQEGHLGDAECGEQDGQGSQGRARATASKVVWSISRSRRVGAR